MGQLHGCGTRLSSACEFQFGCGRYEAPTPFGAALLCRIHGVPEVAANQVLPQTFSVENFSKRMLELASPRLAFLAERDEKWWLTVVPFFDARRERIWIFWRRVLHSAHHWTQLTVYLRLLGKAVPATYGPTADVSWQGADLLRRWRQRGGRVIRVAIDAGG